MNGIMSLYMRLPPGTPIPEVTVTAWIVFAQKGNAKAKAGDKKIDREIRLNLIYFFIINSFLIWQVQHI